MLKRIEFRSTADFLANSGGLFGLFIGASFLSLFEFIYFFVIRIFNPHQRAEPANTEIEANEQRVDFISYHNHNSKLTISALLDSHVAKNYPNLNEVNLGG